VAGDARKDRGAAAAGHRRAVGKDEIVSKASLRYLERKANIRVVRAEHAGHFIIRRRIGN
jgi:hypothetical protein